MLHSSIRYLSLCWADTKNIMTRTKSDISNSAIRIFLQKVGRFYDEARGYVPIVPTSRQKEDLLKYFEYTCCYCGVGINKDSFSQDHLIPMNKTALGLHAWGNVVPCCAGCNNAKQQRSWTHFANQKDSANSLARIKKINEFVLDKKYDARLNLHEVAGNLYEDIGEVALTLINLRYIQAKNIIENKSLGANLQPSSATHVEKSA